MCLVVIVGLLLAARRASLVRIVWTRRCRLIQLCSFFIHCLCHAVQIALIVWVFFLLLIILNENSVLILVVVVTAHGHIIVHL